MTLRAELQTLVAITADQPSLDAGHARRSRSLFGQRAGKPEVGEHAAVGKEGDLGDVAAREREHEHAVRAPDLSVWAGEVAAERGLSVCAGRDEPQRRAA